MQARFASFFWSSTLLRLHLYIARETKGKSFTVLLSPIFVDSASFAHSGHLPARCHKPQSCPSWKRLLWRLTTATRSVSLSSATTRLFPTAAMKVSTKASTKNHCCANWTSNSCLHCLCFTCYLFSIEAMLRTHVSKAWSQILVSQGINI